MTRRKQVVPDRTLLWLMAALAMFAGTQAMFFGGLLLGWW